VNLEKAPRGFDPHPVRGFLRRVHKSQAPFGGRVIHGCPAGTDAENHYISIEFSDQRVHSRRLFRLSNLGARFARAAHSPIAARLTVR